MSQKNDAHPMQYYIVLDTNIFGKKECYNFKSGKIAGIIKNLSNYSNIHIYIPDIVVNELKSHISENIYSVYNKMEKGYLKNYCKDKINDAVKENYNELDLFIITSKIEVINCSENLNVSDVNNWYFNRIPPFSEKKKEEFPDAMIISSIMNYFKDFQDRVIIISEDNDVKEAINKHTNFEIIQNLSPLLEELFEFTDAQTEKIKRYIYNKRIFNDINIYDILSNDSLDTFDIDNLKISINYIDAIDKIEENRYVINVNVNIELEGEFSLIDYGLSVFDDECSAIFSREGNQIEIRDFDIYTEIKFDKNANIVEIIDPEMDQINLSDYVNQLELIDC